MENGVAKEQKYAKASVTGCLGYFFNVCPFTTIQICHKAYNILCKSKFKILPNTTQTLKNCQHFKILPKW